MYAVALPGEAARAASLFLDQRGIAGNRRRGQRRDMGLGGRGGDFLRAGAVIGASRRIVGIQCVLAAKQQLANRDDDLYAAAYGPGIA